MSRHAIGGVIGTVLFIFAVLFVLSVALFTMHLKTDSNGNSVKKISSYHPVSVFVSCDALTLCLPKYQDRLINKVWPDKQLPANQETHLN